MIATKPRAEPTTADAALDDALALLDRHQITFATLRRPGRDRTGVLEADLLVAPRDRSRAERLLAARGFRRRPGWGRHPHRFLLRPVGDGNGLVDDPPLDWLKLDLVTDLCFGPWQAWSTGLGAACLADRTAGPGARLAPADELMALLLHALLDKGYIRPGDAERLTELATRAVAPGVLGRALTRGRSPGPTWDQVLGLITAGAWHEVQESDRALRARLRRRRPIHVAARTARNRTLRRGRSLLEGLARRGPLVALVGPDGTGKTTLATSLLTTAGVPARAFYGGTYRRGIRTRPVPGLTTTLVLAGLLATRARIAWHRRRGRLVVLDRHPEEVRPARREHLPMRTRLRRHLLAASLPRPDLLLILDAPATVLHARRPQHSVAHLEHDRQRHLTMDVPTCTRVLNAATSPQALRSRAICLVWEHTIPTRVLTVPRPAPTR